MSRISSNYRMGFLVSVIGVLLVGLLLAGCGQPAAPASAAANVRPPDQSVLKYFGVVLPLRPGPGTPRITRAQALAIANQDMPGPASEAQRVTAQYVLLDWPTTSISPTSFQPIAHLPTWLVTYVGVHVSLHGTPQQMLKHPEPNIGDVFVFIDATTGVVFSSIASPGTWVK